MGFKLPGIKKAGSSLENLDLNIKTRLPRNDVSYRGTVISRKAAMTAQARKEKGDPTLDPFGATFQPLDTRQYYTSAKFPYIKSRFRVSGDALTQIVLKEAVVSLLKLQLEVIENYLLKKNMNVID